MTCSPTIRPPASARSTKPGGASSNLDHAFRGYRGSQITSVVITKYIIARQTAGASNGTINLELGVLLRMLKLGVENNKVARVPIVHRLKEAAPRAGFFEADAFAAIRAALPEDFRVCVTIAYTYGWRMQSEVLSLERRQVDLTAGTLRLDPGSTKNSEGRVVYLTPELTAMLAEQIIRIETVERQTGQVIPYLFPHLHGPHIGTRRRDIRRAWATACRRTGYAGMLCHDFRRTAARNLANAGVPEKVAMTITGHKTRGIFDRYCIVAPGDLQEASRKLSVLSAAPRPAPVTPIHKAR